MRITLGFSDDETSHDEEQHMTDTIAASTRKDCDGRALCRTLQGKQKTLWKFVTDMNVEGLSSPCNASCEAESSSKEPSKAFHEDC